MARQYIYNGISIHSYNRKSIQSIIGKILSDSDKLRSFLHKIIYIKVQEYKKNVLSLCLKVIHKQYILCDSTYWQQYLNINIHMYGMSLSFNIYKNIDIYYFLQYIYDRNKMSIYMSYLSYIQLYISHVHIMIAYDKASVGVASLPTRVNKFTVLRSPHIDKRSREQFEIRTHKRAYSYISELAPVIRYLYSNVGHVFTSSIVFSSKVIKHEYV